MKKSRMYSFVGPRWNPVVACKHGCLYCWARRQARRQRRRCQLCYEFLPHLHEERLKQRFGYVTVFVVDMGDLLGRWVPEEWILKVIEAMRQSPCATFFLETKNPAGYFKFLDWLPKNSVLSATIESNVHYSEVYKGSVPPPKPVERAAAMADLPWPRKHVSVEPVLKFDQDVLVGWIKRINPIKVSVGYDNYKHRLPEPALNDTLNLITELEKFTEVERKTLRKAWWED